MRYLATFVASLILITPFAAFAQTAQEQHDALVLQLINILTQEVQALESQLNAQSAVPTGGEPSTFSTTITPLLQQLTMPQDQTEIIVHDDSEFYQAKDGNHVYSIYVKNANGEFDPTTVATVTNGTDTHQITLNAQTLFDTSTAMGAPHREWGTLYHSSTPFTVSALGIDKEITQ